RAAPGAPGASHLCPLRLPRTKVAVATLPRTRSRTMRPEQGRPEFQTVASLAVFSRSAYGPWIVSAFGANSAPAARSLLALSARLHARTTSAGVLGARAAAVPDRTTATTVTSADTDVRLPMR